MPTLAPASAPGPGPQPHLVSQSMPIHVFLPTSIPQSKSHFTLLHSSLPQPHYQSVPKQHNHPLLSTQLQQSHSSASCSSLLLQPHTVHYQHSKPSTPSQPHLILCLFINISLSLSLSLKSLFNLNLLLYFKLLLILSLIKGHNLLHPDLQKILTKI